MQTKNKTPFVKNICLHSITLCDKYVFCKACKDSQRRVTFSSFGIQTGINAPPVSKIKAYYCQNTNKCNTYGSLNICFFFSTTVILNMSHN